MVDETKTPEPVKWDNNEPIYHMTAFERNFKRVEVMRQVNVPEGHDDPPLLYRSTAVLSITGVASMPINRTFNFFIVANDLEWAFHNYDMALNAARKAEIEKFNEEMKKIQHDAQTKIIKANGKRIIPP